MNSKQKTILLIVLSTFVVSLLVWQIFGGEIFTKTQVLVETKDELFGWTEKKWENKFVWGLDLSLVISGASVLIGGILFFLFRNRKNYNQY
ncbi:MAG: LPXTG cell wall anchor domain-containing protein [Bacteroidota bacterium]